MKKRRIYKVKLRPVIIESDHARVDLCKGRYAIIDLHHVEYVQQHNWTYTKGYAARKCKECTPIHRIYLHRVINKTPDGLFTDHIDRDRTNNREVNLRTVTAKQNATNTSGKRSATSKYKGVSWDKEKGRWAVQIEEDGVKRRLGRYHDEEEAGKAYDAGAIATHGKEHIYLNFP